MLLRSCLDLQPECSPRSAQQLLQRFLSLAALAAALWLLGLAYAGGALRSNARPSFADRARDALIIGIAIPTGLAIVHALYPATCWLALAVLATVAYVRRPRELAAPVAEPIPYVLIASLFFVAWPQLMRPPLDGDTLSYHLPNAAAWVHAHSLWTTDGRYWWYPPASEAFAAGIYAAAGPYAVGWAGVAALTLLGARIVTWLRERCGVAPLVADVVAAATITAAPLAQQAGSLQNDVWLAAFFVETLWSVQFEPVAAARAAFVTALIKPYGWIVAIVAVAASRATRAVWIAIAAAATLWFAHDAVLWQHAIVPPAQASSANTWSSTILANGISALALLLRVSVQASPFFALALFAALAGPTIDRGRNRAAGIAALVALLAFLVMPLAFADVRPELAGGSSLRYAIPAAAAGIIAAGALVARFATVSFVIAALSCAFGIVSTLAIYWNDGGTRSALAVAPVAVLLAYVSQRRRTIWPCAAGLALAIVAASWLAARHPVDYYADAYAVNGKPTQLFAWIARAQPRALGGWGLRVGVADVLAPYARTLDLSETLPCASAQANGVTLVALAESDRSPWYNEQRLHVARRCGRVRFDDGIAVSSGISP
jgi:hypothetical protein